MHKGSMQKIKQQILLVTLLPTTALIVLLSAYLLTSRIADLDRGFQERGEAIAQQIAGAAIHGLFTHNYGGLELLAEETLNQHPDAYKINISDRHELMVVDLTDRDKEASAIARLFSAPVQTTRSTDELYEFPIDQPVPTEVNADGALEVGNITLWLDESGLRATRRNIISNTVLLTLSGLLISALLAAFLSARIARPIEQLTDATIQLRKGNLDTRVNTEHEGEIGELQRSFNTMAEEIALANENMQSRIAQATRELNESMEILEIKNVELDLSRQRAVDANRVKSEFLANMSHEIRTPMNGILGFVNLLNKTELSQSQKEHLATIETSAENLLAIINDILDFSKLEAGKLVLEPEPFSLRNCIDNTIALLAPMAHQKQVELVSLVFNDVPDALIGDQTRIAQVITNLVNNAIKFTEYGEVVLRVMVEEEKENKVRLSISVTDTGIGINKNEQENIFSAFSQGRGVRENVTIGTGLGLSICRRLAEAMGGKISVSSKPTEGSCFLVSLLLQKDPRKQLQQSPPERSPLTGLHVLLFDPHQPSRAVLQNDLIAMGLRVSVSETYQQIEDSWPDCDLLVLGVDARTAKNSAAIKAIDKAVHNIELPILFLISGQDHVACGNPQLFDKRVCRSKPIKRSVFRESLEKLILAKTDSARTESQKPITGTAKEQENWLHDKKILAVDDNEINLELIGHLLSSYGAKIVTARDGVEAVDTALRVTPDLVIMDIHMPRMNGFEAAQRIRQELNPCPPIVALTADAMRKNREEIERHQLDGYLIKPISEDKLKDVHGKLLAVRSPQTVDTQEPLPNPTTGNAQRGPANNLPIRDLSQALRIAGGSEKIAEKLLSELLKQLPASLEKSVDSFAREEWEQLWQEVHRLHGAISVCGVPALMQATNELQAAIKQEDHKATSRLLITVEQEVNRLLESFQSS